MSCWVYILQSETDGRYYIGSTQDVAERLTRHNQGRSKYTRGRGPWRVVYQERHTDRAEAVKREYQIKKRRSSAYIKGLVRASRQV